MNHYDYENVFSTVASKAKAFDKLAKYYYRKNFGTLPKSEIDLIMFSVYFDAVMESNEMDPTNIDYSIVSDHKISKVLGITPQKVSSLKMKKHLSFDNAEYDLKANIERIILQNNNLRFEDGYFVVNIPDKYLYSEIKDYIESDYGIVDSSFNSNIMKIPENQFMKLCKICADESEYDEFIQSIEKYSTEKPNDEIKCSKDLLDKIEQGTKIGKNIMDIILGAADLMNPSALVVKKLVFVLKTIAG